MIYNYYYKIVPAEQNYWVIIPKFTFSKRLSIRLQKIKYSRKNKAHLKILEEGNFHLISIELGKPKGFLKINN